MAHLYNTVKEKSLPLIARWSGTSSNPPPLNNASSGVQPEPSEELKSKGMTHLYNTVKEKSLPLIARWSGTSSNPPPLDNTSSSVQPEPSEELKSKGSVSWKKVGVITGVGVLSGCVLVPVAISAAGFTAGGIAAGSLAAKIMSVSAIANGGGVAAGGIVATLQSAGVLGVSASTTALVGGSVAGATACLNGIREGEPKPKD